MTMVTCADKDDVVSPPVGRQYAPVDCYRSKTRTTRTFHRASALYLYCTCVAYEHKI